MIDVNDVVSGFKLADFLESERHFCVPGVVGTQIVLVEAVKDLMIGVKRGTDRRVAETFVQSEVDGGEKCTLDSLTGGLHQLGEDIAQPLLLLLAVGQDESALTVGEIFDKGVPKLAQSSCGTRVGAACERRQSALSRCRWSTLCQNRAPIARKWFLPTAPATLFH